MQQPWNFRGCFVLVRQTAVLPGKDEYDIIKKNNFFSVNLDVTVDGMYDTLFSPY
jgi:hypothetical protein